jgi:hypothetical protein
VGRRGWMATAGIPLGFIGGPGALPGIPSLRGEFTYALLSPPQPTFPARDFNLDRGLGMLNPNMPLVTHSSSLDIRASSTMGTRSSGIKASAILPCLL